MMGFPVNQKIGQMIYCILKIGLIHFLDPHLSKMTIPIIMGEARVTTRRELLPQCMER